MIKTVSLETSKALKEAGFRQDTSYFWYTGYEPRGPIYFKTDLHLMNIKYIHHSNGFASPTSDEILEELPSSIIWNSTEPYGLRIEKDSDKYVTVWYYRENHCGESSLDKFGSESLPEALAQMYLWLSKEGLLKGSNDAKQ